MTFTSLAVARQIVTDNPKSKEHPADYPISELINSQYFRLIPLRQMEVKDLKGFVQFSNENKTIQCVFFKNRIPANVKLELAQGSLWENSSGPTLPQENIYTKSEQKNPNEPSEILVQFSKGPDIIDLKCQFTSKITGQFDNKSDEDHQRSKCESRGGIFTHYSRREFDYACDYKLSYGDLKKVMTSAGFQFEIRKEPPKIAVVVLGEEPQKINSKSKKNIRQPSSLKKK